MRWAGQDINRAADAAALPGLDALRSMLAASGLVRTIHPPEFAGITFHEVLARSALNQVPAAASVPFRWTVNPYRGCSHGCVYCFARNTHTYLDMDAGHDFDSQIVVKVNVADVLRRELARPSWTREAVALGTNTDPYQRAEGRYRLMPGIISALSESGTPFSVLTKGTTVRRDLALLAATAQSVPVSLAVSLALVDEAVHAGLEPGTPSPRARLDLVRAIRAAGLSCQVLVAPILPLLTDSDESLDAVLGEVAAAGATGATVFALHLRPGAREWFLSYLAREHPDLLGGYRDLYRRGAYVAPSYAADLARRADRLLRRHGLDRSAGARSPGARSRGARPPPNRAAGVVPQTAQAPTLLE